MFEFNRKERGQGLVEFALILVLIAIVVIVAMQVLGDKVSDTFDTVNSGLSADGSGGASSPTAVPTVDPYADYVAAAAMGGSYAIERFCNDTASGTPYKWYTAGSGWDVAGGSNTDLTDRPNHALAGTGTCP